MLDAIVGGGGLIQIPLLFWALPDTSPLALLGTNKLSSVFGTAVATLRYARRVDIPWRTARPAALMAFLFAYAGAASVSSVPPLVLRPLVLAMLVAVAVYTFARKDFGAIDRSLVGRPRDSAIAVALGSAIGFYDGFLGPGTGSFLIFVLARFFGFDFLRASATAKLINVCTNLAALLYFARSGNVMWTLGLGMAGCNVAGSILGSHLALRHGVNFVRKVFLAVTVVLIGKFGWDTLSG